MTETTTKTANATKWIIRNKNTGKWMNKDSRYGWTAKPTNAAMFSTRKTARHACKTNQTIDKIVFLENGVQITPQWR